MAIIPFDCIWRDAYVEVVQVLDGKIVNQAGVYNVLPKEICEKCGNPYLVKIQNKYECLEGYLHDHLKDVDGTFQLGHYYKKSSMALRKPEDTLNEHIWGLKRDPEYAKPLAKAMFMIIKHHFPILLNADLIIPVPNHEDDYHRDAKAVALAKELEQIMKKDLPNIRILEALQKVKNVSVLRLNQEEREAAVEGMFQFESGNNISNKKVILVDDVLTAGNIKGKCATILKEHGAQKVWLLVAGRTI